MSKLEDATVNVKFEKDDKIRLNPKTYYSHSVKNEQTGSGLIVLVT